jgi:phage-related protein
MAFPHSLHAWEANKYYDIGDVVRASREERHTLAFKCIQRGTSGDNEPVFPRQITSTVVDNEVEWEAFEPLAEQLQALAPTAIIDLFEIKLTLDRNGVADTLRYHAGKNELISNIVFDGKTYPAAPVEVDGFEATAKGALPRPTLRVANVNGAISSLLAQYNPLGARVRRIRTFAKFLDDENFTSNPSFFPEEGSTVSPFVGPIAPFATQQGDPLISQKPNPTADPDAKMVETWYIDRVSSENLQFVEFELTAKLDLTNLQLPRRTVTEFCQWVYRERDCPYRGDQYFDINDQPVALESQDVCGKRLSSCKARFPKGRSDKCNALPFGGFPGARLQA